MAMHAMPTITDANNEKIVVEKPNALVAGLDDPGTSCAGEPQPATSVAPCVIASLIWINIGSWNRAHQKIGQIL